MTKHVTISLILAIILGILHESVYTFSWHFGCIQVSGLRCETGRTCAVLKANAANLNTETRPSFRKKCKLLLLDFERCLILPIYSALCAGEGNR